MYVMKFEINTIKTNVFMETVENYPSLSLNISLIRFTV